MVKISTKKEIQKRKRKLRKLLQLLDDSSGTSDTSSHEQSETDSDSDVPLSNLVQTPTSDSGVSTNQGVQNILALLGNQTSGIKGPEVNADVAALLSGFLLHGIEKDSRNSLMESYPCLANCSHLQPPTINPEIRSCLDANAVKQDNFLQKIQSQLAAAISALAVSFDKQYELTKVNATEDTRKNLEKCCDPLKIIADVFHALSLHRRYSILPYLDSNVRKVLEACPIDEFLFGKVFPEQLKSANEAQRLGFTIKKKEKAGPRTPSVKRLNEQKPGPSKTVSSLNFRRLPQRSRMKKEEGRPRSSRSYRTHRNQ